MKFKLNSDFFWPMLIIWAIAVVAGIGASLWCILEKEFLGILLFFIPTILLCIAFYHDGKDLFSIILITEKGITVSCFGKTFFDEPWEGISYIGEYQVMYRYQLRATPCIYFSKTPIDLGKRKFRGGAGSGEQLSTRRMKGQAVFMTLTPKAREQIKKCYQRKIKDHGVIEPYLATHK